MSFVRRSVSFIIISKTLSKKKIQPPRRENISIPHIPGYTFSIIDPTWSSYYVPVGQLGGSRLLRGIPYILSIMCGRFIMAVLREVGASCTQTELILCTYVPKAQTPKLVHKFEAEPS